MHRKIYKSLEPCRSSRSVTVNTGDFYRLLGPEAVRRGCARMCEGRYKREDAIKEVRLCIINVRRALRQAVMNMPPRARADNLTSDGALCSPVR